MAFVAFSHHAAKAITYTYCSFPTTEPNITNLAIMLKLEQTSVDRALNDVFPGNVFAIGGRVRDALFNEYHGTAYESKDADYVIAGTTFENARERLGRIGAASQVGASFACIKAKIHDVIVDLAFPRGSTQSSPENALKSVIEDIYLRDFTMNGVSYRLADDRIFAHQFALRDLRDRKLRMAHSDAFSDDPTRLWRGVQFVGRFGLSIDLHTEAKMREQAHLLSTQAPQRIGEELMKLLGKSPSCAVAFDLARRTGILDYTIPELAQTYGVEQNIFHRFDVFGHTVEAIEFAPRTALDRLAALCHDLGKTDTQEVGNSRGATFHGHESVGADMTAEMLRRLRLPNELVDATATLVREHMYVVDPSITDGAVRRFIKRVGPELIERQFTLRHADAAGCGLPRPGSEARNASFELRVRTMIAMAPVLTPKHLAIDGDTIVRALIKSGLKPSCYRGDATVGNILGRLLDDVIENPAVNTSEALRERLGQSIEKIAVKMRPSIGFSL